jgi:large subunit ribosomal protein L24
MKLKIKKGSTVEVIAGAERGKRGSVLEVDRNHLKIKIQGVKVMTHYDKKDGLLKKEGFIDYSNVRLVEAAPAKKAAAKTTKKSTGKEPKAD